MHSKINIHNFWRSHTFIVLMFAIMSLMSSVIMWSAHYVYPGQDLFFHVQRIYDLRTSILNGNWNPVVALNQYHQSGSAVMSLYPKMNLYPIVFLSFIFKNFVDLYYITFIIRNFFALVVAYVASFNYNRNKIVSFIFSITYTLTAITISNGITTYDLGKSSSSIFIPLVMFGFMELLRCNRWIELTIGMTLIILSHVLNTVIVVSFLLMLTIININKFKDVKKVLSLAKAVVTTALLTSVFLIPFTIIMEHNSIFTPSVPWPLGGTSFPDLLSNVFSNGMNPWMTITMLIGLILGIVNYKHLETYSKQLLWIAIVYIFVCSDFFPWTLLVNTSLNDILQFTWRLYVIPDIILAYMFAESILFVFNDKKESEIMLVIVTVATMGLQMVAQNFVISTSHNYPFLNTVEYDSLPNAKISSNYSFSKLINGDKPVEDYYPNKAVPYIKKIDGHTAYDDNRSFKINSKGNGKFTFTNKKYIKNLSLPFLYYNGINYQVKLDGKTVNEYPNKHALMTINNVSKGNHHVQIIVHKTKAEIASYVLSLAGLIILLGAIIKGYILKRKNKDK